MAAAKTVSQDCYAAIKRKITKYSKQVTVLTKAVVKVFKAKASASQWTDTGIVGAAVLLIDRYLKGTSIIRVYDTEVNQSFNIVAHREKHKKTEQTKTNVFINQRN